MTKKEQILQKALEMINEKGYMNVGVREIARALEMSPGNLSYHFSKKEDILIAMLEQFQETNSSSYEDYLAQTPSLERFLELMKKIFESQYHYRGVFIGNQFVQAEIESGERFNYKETQAKRIAGFTKIFRNLDAAGQLKVTEEDISFLVSHITLVGRFWIYEATLFNKSPEKEQTIKYYLFLLAKQLSLFATQAGLNSINKFIKV